MDFTKTKETHLPNPKSYIFTRIHGACTTWLTVAPQTQTEWLNTLIQTQFLFISQTWAVVVVVVVVFPLGHFFVKHCFFWISAYHLAHASSDEYISAIGHPGMKSPDVRVGLEAWNFCNEVGMEAPNMGSPRLADCADLCCPLIIGINICMLLYSFQL